uniref:hypothetical protein n=1 Tax=Butyrivibrio sp. NC3005 TaxID=1280685 RepID=UPI00055DE200
MSLYAKEFASDRLTNEIQQLDMQITSLQKEKHEGKITDVGATYLKELTKKTLKISTFKGFSKKILMRKKGLEPSRYNYHKILSLARLPIPT